MTVQSFTVTRNVDATDQLGQPCKIALATVIHENGTHQTVAINEALIAYAGEGVIKDEVNRAAASPSDTQFRKRAIQLPKF